MNFTHSRTQRRRHLHHLQHVAAKLTPGPLPKRPHLAAVPERPPPLHHPTAPSSLLFLPASRHQKPQLVVQQWPFTSSDERLRAAADGFEFYNLSSTTGESLRTKTNSRRFRGRERMKSIGGREWCTVWVSALVWVWRRGSIRRRLRLGEGVCWVRLDGISVCERMASTNWP